MKIKRLTVIAGAAITLVAGLAACGGGAHSSGGGTADTLTVNMAFGRGVVTTDFNPFSPNATEGTLGLIFEPLMGVDILHNDKFVPWLATSEQMSADGKTLTLTLDPRATWSDATPLTASDVVYTFDLLKKYPATNYQYSAQFDTVQAVDSHTVRFTFSGPGYTQIGNILSEYIVPQKYWTGHDPVTWTNPNPVGSGAYTEKRLIPQQLTLQAHGSYWRQKTINVKYINFPVVGSNTSAEVANLVNGSEDWSGGNLASVLSEFTAKSSRDQYWYPTYGALFLYFNLDKPVFQDIHVRKAIELAIDKQQLIKLMKQVGASAISQTGLDPSTQSAWLDPAYQQPVATDLAAAKQQLIDAGYTFSGGKAMKNGKQLSFNVKEVSDFTDSVQREQLIAAQLAGIGIAMTVTPEGSSLYGTDRNNGNFDAVMGGFAYGATPWLMYNSMMNSSLGGTAKGGAAQYANWGRYRDPATDTILNAFAGAGSTAAQVQDAQQLESIVVNQVPFVTISSITEGCEYTTKNWTGWPSASDPYAVCPPWAGGPWNEMVVLNLRPSS